MYSYISERSLSEKLSNCMIPTIQHSEELNYGNNKKFNGCILIKDSP